MELTWPNRIRIIAAMAVGAIFIGFIAWPMVQPSFANGAITFYEGDINAIEALICVILSFIVGFVGYFLSWPYGLRIAPLSVPAGLAIWCLQSGNMFRLLLINSTAQQRNSVYSALKWEGFFWLLLVAVGYLGVLAANHLFKPGKQFDIEEDTHHIKTNKVINVALSVFVSVIVANFAMSLLARDVRMPVSDKSIGYVMGQPETVQIAFAAIVSFGLAAFLVKLFLQSSYIIPACSTVIVIWFFMPLNPIVIDYMVQNWPLAFYPRAMNATLPIQIVSFGTIGAIAGYWLAISYKHWQKTSA